MSLWLRLAIGAGVLILLAGCGVLPQIAHQPTYHNPFPQLTKIAVAPFFNTSSERTVDGRQFANAYFHELQSIPGFEVVPVGIVEQKAQELGLSLANPVEVRKLAQELEVDAIVIGAVTDFSPYYPPRCAMQVEWYAANPCFHAIPVGYGLPWGTPEEEYIPDTLVLETELGLAREQLKTQTPEAQVDETIPVNHRGKPKAGNLMAMLSGRDRKPKVADGPRDEDGQMAAQPKRYPGQQLAYRDEMAQASKDSTSIVTSSSQPGELASVLSNKSRADLSMHRAGRQRRTDGTAASKAGATTLAGEPEVIAPGLLPARSSAPLAAGTDGVVAAAHAAPLPPNWPDPRGLVPLPPSAVCPDCQPTFEPVLRHTRAYNGNDVRFTTALETYAFFRDDARMGGWQSYLQRSDDFIRFCCHLHLTEMLTARGGAGETRVVWRWPDGR